MPTGRAVLFRLATSSQLERAVRALPGGEQRAWRAASRYVAGGTLGEVLATVQKLGRHGAGSSIDQFGELVGDAATADRVASDYLKLADQLTTLPGTTWLSVDLSHLGLDVDPRRCTNISLRLPVRCRPADGSRWARRTMTASIGC